MCLGSLLQALTQRPAPPATWLSSVLHHSFCRMDYDAYDALLHHIFKQVYRHHFSGKLNVLTSPADARRCLVQAVGGEYPCWSLSSSRCRSLPCIPLRESLPGTFRGFSARTQPCSCCQDSQRCHPRRPCLRVRYPGSTCLLPSDWYPSFAAKTTPTLSISMATLGFRSLIISPGSRVPTKSSAAHS